MNKRSFFAILSALVVSAGTLGGFSSCNLSKANGNLPAVKDSTALFDYFTYKIGLKKPQTIQSLYCLGRI